MSDVTDHRPLYRGISDLVQDTKNAFAEEKKRVQIAAMRRTISAWPQVMRP